MSTHEHAGPGYASPQVARQQAPEKLIYVAALYERTGIEKPDFVAVVDVDPSSSSYGQIVGRTDMPNVGDELHHFGWNACSSACHSQLKRWITKLDRQPDGTYALDDGFFVDFAEQTDGARPHEIHLRGGDCTTEIFQ